MAQRTAQSQQTQLPVSGEVPERPLLAPNVQLIGELQGTGFDGRQWLVQRDGRFVQLTELLYRIAEQADGERTLDQIAARVTDSGDRLVTAEHVRYLIQVRLMPLGLIAVPDRPYGLAAERQPRSPLQINARRRILAPRHLDRVTRLLQVLYAPPVLIPVLLATTVAHAWLYFIHGVGESIRAALYTPGGLVLVLAIALAAGVFHEFGHAAALRYGGGQVRGMGVGFYLIYPTIYTDVSDCYRLGRWARLRTDLGGIYFHLIFVLGLIALYFVSGQELLLAAVLLINLEILYQFLPYVRLDGYWALADLVGVPDFFSQMGPFLRSVLPVPAAQGPRLPALKPWVKAVFALYILLTLPVLALLVVVMVIRAPTLLLTAWDAMLHQATVLSTAVSRADLVLVAGATSQMVLLALPLVGLTYVAYRFAWRPVRALWSWSKPTWRRRAIGALAAAGALALIGLQWAPRLPIAREPAPPGVERFQVTERSHVQMPVSYPHSPPLGGRHAPIWQNCGFYEIPVANENAVHSLEHGAVWITYRPDLPSEQVATLRQLARGHTHVLISPYPRLPAPVVASAWGHQLQLDSGDDPRLAQFVRAFELSPQAPERGGPCTGGVGAPS